jgi:tetratricopeptide (TPR) repeat protein
MSTAASPAVGGVADDIGDEPDDETEGSGGGSKRSKASAADLAIRQYMTLEHAHEYLQNAVVLIQRHEGDDATRSGAEGGGGALVEAGIGVGAGGAAAAAAAASAAAAAAATADGKAGVARNAGKTGPGAGAGVGGAAAGGGGGAGSSAAGNNTGAGNGISGGSNQQLPLRRVLQAVLLNIAYVSLCLNNPVQALRYARQLLDMADCDPVTCAQARLYCAEAQCLLSHVAEAQRTLAEAPSNQQQQVLPTRERVATLVALANVHVLQEQLDEAEAVVRRALKLSPGCSEAMRLIVYINLKRGRTAKALRLIKTREVPLD